ncbi:hypothetical protein CR513_50869, partial [Mucuna pruriens]
MNSSNMQFQQNMNATIQDLKMRIGYHLQSAGSSNLPSQTIPNPRGNASVVTLRSGKELQQPAPQQLPRPTDGDSELNANSAVEDVLEGGNRHSTPRCNKADSQVRKIPQEIMCAQKEEDKMRCGSRRYSVGIDQKRRHHYRSLTSTTEEMSRPRNFLCPMYHWRLYFCRCRAGLRSVN